MHCSSRAPSWWRPPRTCWKSCPSCTLRQAAAPAPDGEPGEREDGILAALGFDPVSLDALVARTGVAAAQLQAKLLELELQGDVARLPGGLFQRVGAG